MTPEGIAAVFRAEYGRAVAVLVRMLGDIDLAEDAVADAFATALRRWPDEGAPPSPAAWVSTATTCSTPYAAICWPGSGEQPTPGRRSMPPHGSPRISANATTCSRGVTH
jgi:hypothetical protein